MKYSFTRLSICITLIVALVSCSDDPTSSDDDDDPPSNSAPTATVTSNAETVTVGEEVTLDASESSDPDGDDLSYTWELNGPDDSDAQLSATEGESTTFTPDVAGDYEATLEVSDGNNASDEDEAMVTAESDEVEVSSDIRESETWTSDNLYRVTDAINVESDAVLTIEAGVTVEFEANAGIRVDTDNAALSIEGTEEDSVILTGVEKNPGFWRGIAFDSGHPSNSIDHAIIEYGGYESWSYINEAGNVTTRSGSRLALTNSTLRYSDAFGLYKEGSTDFSEFSNNTFSDNNIPVSIPTTLMGSMDGESSYTGNTNNYVLVEEDDVYRQMSVSALEVPYLLEGEPRIDTGGEVTINGGATLEFKANAGIRVDSDDAALIVEGTSDNIVTFTGAQDEVGYWRGIAIDSNNPLNKIDHAVIEYGGYESWSYINEAGNVSMRSGSRLALSNSTLRHSDSFGFYVETGSLPDFANNTFSDNNIPVSIPTTLMGAMDGESSYTGNSNDYVLVEEDDVYDDMTISELGVRYRIERTPQIDGDAIVTFSAGAALEFKANAGISLESDNAAIIAEGEAENMVLFTGVDTQKGYWRGIKIDSDNPLNEFTYTKVSYGGYSSWSYIEEAANISLRNNAQLTLSNCEIQFSAAYGVWADAGTDANVTATGNYYSNNDAEDYNY